MSLCCYNSHTITKNIICDTEKKEATSEDVHFYKCLHTAQILRKIITKKSVMLCKGLYFVR